MRIDHAIQGGYWLPISGG